MKSPYPIEVIPPFITGRGPLFFHTPENERLVHLKKSPLFRKGKSSSPRYTSGGGQFKLVVWVTLQGTVRAYPTGGEVDGKIIDLTQKCQLGVDIMLVPRRVFG